MNTRAIRVLYVSYTTVHAPRLKLAFALRRAHLISQHIQTMYGKEALMDPKLYVMLLVIAAVQSPMTYDLVDSLVGQATGMKLITGADGRPGKVGLGVHAVVTLVAMNLAASFM